MIYGPLGHGGTLKRRAEADDIERFWRRKPDSFDRVKLNERAFVVLEIDDGEALCLVEHLTADRGVDEIKERLAEIDRYARGSSDLGTAYWKIVRARELLTDVRAYLETHAQGPYYAAALLDALNTSASTQTFLADETAKINPPPGAPT